MSCAHVHFSIHVNTCVDWKLIERCVGLPEADLTAVDGDNRTVEEKRVGMMEKWKERFSFRATYRVFVE